jgi:hypothetical protein
MCSWFLPPDKSGVMDVGSLRDQVVFICIHGVMDVGSLWDQVVAYIWTTNPTSRRDDTLSIPGCNPGAYARYYRLGDLLKTNPDRG